MSLPAPLPPAVVGLFLGGVHRGKRARNRHRAREIHGFQSVRGERTHKLPAAERRGGAGIRHGGPQRGLDLHRGGATDLDTEAFRHCPGLLDGGAQYVRALLAERAETVVILLLLGSPERGPSSRTPANSLVPCRTSMLTAHAAVEGLGNWAICFASSASPSDLASLARAVRAAVKAEGTSV
ncbi:hypothetical protein AHiyo8_23770 [Arthrobacter sp. Hiyo8]|nr:hypothetical protein AHiyo8_23770 [Arthrobacter sp. Hiyo8]